jgi:hypothetical protein
MDTNEHQLLAIVGRAIDVVNTPGHGLCQDPYDDAWCVEFNFGASLSEDWIDTQFHTLRFRTPLLKFVYISVHLWLNHHFHRERFRLT